MKSFIQFLNEYRIRYPATWVNRDTHEEITFNSEAEKNSYFNNLPHGTDKDWYPNITREDDKADEEEYNERMEDLIAREKEAQEKSKPKFKTPEEKRHYEEIWYI